MKGKLKKLPENKTKSLIIILIILLSLLLSSNIAFAQDNATKKVIFDETGPYQGKMYTIHNTGFWGSSSFGALLEENGYSVSLLTDAPITSEKLKGYDILVIMAQYRDYSDEEIKVIKDFVKNGGGLFFMGNAWSETDGSENWAFNKIARSFGLNFSYNDILTKENNYLFTPNIFEINNVTSNPVTANVPKYIYSMGTYFEDPGNSSVIAYTTPDTFADTGVTTVGGDTIPNYKKDPNEKSGPFPVLSTMQYGKGKIVFSGSVELFTNGIFYQSNAWKLGLNSVNWLTNQPAPTNYKIAGTTSLNIIGFQVVAMLLFSAIVFSGLFFKIRRDRKSELSRVINTIKNWKFNGLIVLNAFFALLGGLLFFPIQYYLYNITNFSFYDPNLGYTLLITGTLFLFFMGVILFNLVARQRLLINYSSINIAILLLFAGITFILGSLYGFTMMEIFTIGSLILLIPLFVNLWIHRGYGQDLIIEGKEFDRLKKLPTKSLPFELQPFYTDAVYIGEGGFGRVFKATNKEGEQVALKIPKTFDKRSESTFITEVSHWSQLNHPHIVKLNEYKILPIPYIETEFCDERLEKGLKSLDEAVSIVYEAAKGLEYAHSKNIIHGDIKMSNILIKNGIYKISDWGLSKLKIGESVTLSGATPQYAAPEQISQEYGKADERTDIYQLGTVFYEMVTGRLPFLGDISQIYNSILTTNPEEPSKINSNAEPINDIIMKCLSKRKENRYASMRELIKELEKFMPADETRIFDNS